MNQFNPNVLKLLSLLSLLVVIYNCEYERQNDVENYHQLVDKAELAICDTDFHTALENYGLAFRQIKRPFGKDVYNAALAAQASEYHKERDQYLQQLIDGSEELGFIKKTFLSNFMKGPEWDILESNRKLDYDATLRTEMAEIRNREQLFRHDHANYGDTISALRDLNLNRLMELTAASGFPSHLEIGYSDSLVKQPHHIVLEHTAQKRNGDKSITNLETVLRVAVYKGRIDPELAILYLKLQDDSEMGRFEIYSACQYRHPLLPDSMSNAFWIAKTSDSDRAEINEIRMQWYADPIEDIQIKATFLASTDLPFIFTSVNQSVANISMNITAEAAVEQYLFFTSNKKMAK